MNYTKKRWFILFVVCLANLCLGSIYTWSVFAAPMAEYLSGILGKTLTSADLAIVYTIANSVGPITMISGGWVNDKFGPKKVLFVGGMMWGLGMLLSGFATSVGFLIVSYALIGGLGLGMAYGTAISSCIKFFPDKSGLVGGIITAVYGFGSVALPPIVTAIVNKFDAPTAFKIVGIAFCIILAFCSFTIEKCPPSFIPDGWTPREKKKSNSAFVNKDWKGMLQTPAFYVMILLFTCGAFTGMMITSQASAVARNLVGMSAIAASTAVSVLALFNVFGRILAGYSSDKIGRILTLAFSCVLGAIGLLCLYKSGEDTNVIFYIGISIVGLCFGSFMGVFPGFTASKFGTLNNSVNYGIMFIGVAIAGYFGPTVMGSIYRQYGTYQNAFLVACALNIFGIVLTIIYSILDKREKRANS
ncbi:OFA family MFS transporter [Brachyspira pilosicoli]|uniref:L-lactate MFS transporter n=1 Tax=Brachyspira pilosicoli TaxID=52584 RepID=UPI0012F4EC15|nr:OFA family MFS transporter [Brachyspira pilosicoli]